MLSIKSLPPAQRKAWRAMYEHYVFASNGDAGAHLPEARRGILSVLKPDALKRLRMALAKALSRS